MIIDIVFAVLVILAIFKGYQRGLIVGLFSLIAILVGLAAAMKLSTVVASYLGSAVNISDKWLPVISFTLVFLVVLLLVRWGANAIENAVEVVKLGWLNKIAGILLYLVLYITIFSIIIFYGQLTKTVAPETIQESVTYSFVQPWGPKAINSFGTMIPLFQDMFQDLQNFFDGVSKDIPPSK